MCFLFLRALAASSFFESKNLNFPTLDAAILSSSNCLGFFIYRFHFELATNGALRGLLWVENDLSSYKMSSLGISSLLSMKPVHHFLLTFSLLTFLGEGPMLTKNDAPVS